MQSDPAETASRYADDEVVQGLLRAMDFFVFFATAIFYSTAFAGRLDIPNGAAIITFFALALALLCIMLLRDLGLYKAPALLKGGWGFLKSAATVLITGSAAFSLLDYFLIPLSPQWPVYWTLIVTSHLALSRFVAQAWARPVAAQGRFRKRIAIVGGGKVAEEALTALESSHDLDIEIIGLFDDRFDGRSPQSIHAHEKMGRIADLAAYAGANRVDFIIVAIPLSAEARLLYILKRLWELPVDIRISGNASRLKFSPCAYTFIGLLPLLLVFDRPVEGWGCF